MVVIIQNLQSPRSLNYPKWHPPVMQYWLVPVPVTIPMGLYPYPYPWVRTRTRTRTRTHTHTHTHSQVVPVPKATFHSTTQALVHSGPSRLIVNPRPALNSLQMQEYFKKLMKLWENENFELTIYIYSVVS